MDYVIVESRGPDAGDATVLGLVDGLAAAGHRVTIFLVQAGVSWPVLDAARFEAVTARPGISVLVDGFSVALRALDGDQRLAGYEVANEARLVSELTRGRVKAIWH
jgi:hypothetical protein